MLPAKVRRRLLKTVDVWRSGIDRDGWGAFIKKRIEREDEYPLLIIFRGSRGWSGVREAS